MHGILTALLEQLSCSLHKTQYSVQEISPKRNTSKKNTSLCKNALAGINSSPFCGLRK